MSQSLLSREKIIAANDLKHEDVPVPEWGGTVRITQMDAGTSLEFNEAMRVSKEAGQKHGIFLMLVFSARNEQGERILTVEDLPALMGKSMNVLTRLQAVALRMNKMGEEGKAELKKDLAEMATGASSTDSPDVSAT